MIFSRLRSLRILLVTLAATLIRASGFVVSDTPLQGSTHNSHKSTGHSMQMADMHEDNPLLLVSLLDKIGLDESAKVRLVLASQSPRRKEILDMMMLKGKYAVETPPLDESKLQRELTEKGVTSAEYTCRLAEAKALALAECHLAEKKDARDDIPTFYLGSDTVVEIDEGILNKPKDPADAKRMLTLMSGRQHHVHTGVAVYRLQGSDVSLVSSFTDTASVTFCKLSPETIDAYVSTGEPLDKAGTWKILVREVVPLVVYFVPNNLRSNEQDPMEYKVWAGNLLLV
jgi:septum formation protein